MESDLKSKLESELDFTSWSALQDHHKREALFLVSQSIDLIEVGLAIAKDNVSQVKIWQQNDSLRRPKKNEVSDWEKSDHSNIFQFLVIRPYVIVKIKDSQ